MGCGCGKKKKDIRYYSTEEQAAFAKSRDLSVTTGSVSAKKREPKKSLVKML